MEPAIENDEMEPVCFDDAPDEYCPPPDKVHTCSGCGASWAEVTDDFGHYHIVEYSQCTCRE